MLWSNILIPTVKEDPQDAEIMSHKLMIRAGLIRRLSSGLYSFLPLGLRALHKVSAIVREEMNRAGAQEVLMPALQPRDLWERSGRYENMTDVMFNLEDKNGRALVLGPTHEEVITEIVAREISSYRQLPVNFYQIQTKFRDEIRPRFGLMRAREFIMKDAYSFDLTWDAADKSYQKMYDAYERIFARCGLKTMAVEADTGAIGGSASHEFMVIADSGEDGVMICEESGYAANLEKAEAQIPELNDPECPAAEKVATPGMKTIDEVSNFLKIDPARTIKTLVYQASEEKRVMVLIPGDRDINEIKLARALDVHTVTLADDASVSKLGPIGFLGATPDTPVEVLADLRLRGARDRVTGANEVDAHLQHYDLARDGKVDRYEDICLARAGDLCPRSGKPMEMRRGIEVGHVFKLGTKYSEKLNARVLDAAGQQQLAVMGCYGIGVTRTLAAALEQIHDDNGIRWPISIAPFEVLISVLDADDAEVMGLAGKLAEQLEARQVDVLVDDRDERPGFKFKDADLIGIPIRVTMGRRGLNKGIVELKLRHERDFTPCAPEEIFDKVEAAREALWASVTELVPGQA